MANDFRNIWQSCSREEMTNGNIDSEIARERLFTVTASRRVQLREAGACSRCQPRVCPRWGGAGRLLGARADGSYSLLQPLGQPSCSKGDVRDLSHGPARCLRALQSAGIELLSPCLVLLKYLATKYRPHQVLPFREWLCEVTFVNFVPRYSVFP